MRLNAIVSKGDTDEIIKLGFRGTMWASNHRVGFQVPNQSFEKIEHLGEMIVDARRLFKGIYFRIKLQLLYNEIKYHSIFFEYKCMVSHFIKEKIKITAQKLINIKSIWMPV